MEKAPYAFVAGVSICRFVHRNVSYVRLLVRKKRIYITERTSIQTTILNGAYVYIANELLSHF